MAVRALREFPLVVNVSITQEDALSGWWRQVLWLLAPASFVSACVVFLVWIFARQFRRLTPTGMNQQLALEALLLDGRAALAS